MKYIKCGSYRRIRGEERRDEMVYQLTPALLDAMVLAIAEGEDAYGYMIAQRLKSIA